MSELPAILGNVPAFFAIVCLYYLIAVLSGIELFAIFLNDNGGWRIVPLLKGYQGLIKVFY